MPPKYSHVKRRTVSGLLRKEGAGFVKDTGNHHHHHRPNPLVDRTIAHALTAVAQLERDISRMLLIRYEQDIARLYSTRLYSVALIQLPTFVIRCTTLYGPSWLAHNHDSEEIKDFLRAVISMDMRQAGERVATKSALWSYTALRHFAMSNNIPICSKRGLHTLRLLPFHSALKSQLEALEAAPPATFSKPSHLGSLKEGEIALRDACELKYEILERGSTANWDADWQDRVCLGYDRLARTLWVVAREFDVRGYGLVLREKLTNKWCDCGCSSDHLGEVCERTVREDEEGDGVKVGKKKEWDGRGWGVFAWETRDEEDIWEVNLDFGGTDKTDEDMTISELMEWRYLKAEQEKEAGNSAFRRGDFKSAVEHYEAAHNMEPELPHYQLNLAAAHIKLTNWIEAETACTKALSQHRSTKGYYRRARARIMMNQITEAIEDLNAVLKLQPRNPEALAELAALLPPGSPSSNAQIPVTPIQKPRTQESIASNGHPLPSGPSSLLSSDTNFVDDYDHPLPPPPWPRLKADDRRVKVVLTPASLSTIGLKDRSREKDKKKGTTTRERGETGGKQKKGKGKKQSGTLHEERPSGQVGSGAGTERPKLLEMKEIVKKQMVLYPSWDRYTVKKAD